MKKSKIYVLAIITLVGLFSLVYSIDLKQKNPDTIFLTEKSIAEYIKFKKDAPEKFSLILMRESDASEKEKFYDELKKIESICHDDCEIISARKLKEDKQIKIQNQTQNLMNLEGDGFFSAIILDNSEQNHKKIIEETFKNSFWADKTKFAGMSYTNFLLDRYSESIQKTLFPVMFIMGFALTLFFIVDFKESLMIYLPCLYMAGVSLLTLKVVDGSMNMVTSIIPLVVFTISLSLSFHVFYSIKEFATISNFLKIKWRPLFLMIFTTYVGFLSLYVAEISVVKKFGLISSQLILLSVLVLYFWFKSLEKKIFENKNRGRVLKLEAIFHHTLPLPVIILLSFVGIFSAILIPSRLPIITDATKYFPANSNLRAGIIEVTEKVSGMPLTEILIDLEKDLDYTQILALSQIEQEIEKKFINKKMKLLSLNNLLKLINFKYSGENKIPINLPSYFTLRGQIPLSLQESYLIESHYRMTILGSPMDVHDYEIQLQEIEKVLKSYKLKYRINGLHHNLMTSQKSMIDILYESFLVSGLLVFFVSALYLQKPRLIIGFAVVNIIPILFAFLYMYIMGYSINIATVMTFSIALGLLGDSTFHISHAKIFPFKTFSDYSSAVLTPVLLSGVLLFLCFVIFLINDFHPIKEFGGILAFMILGGYFADLFILPSIIYGNHKHRDHYEKEIKQKSDWFVKRDKLIKK